MTEFRPRPKQKEVLSYTGGYMGVAAVPGSGKTWTLSVLASELITNGHLGLDQEVLIVTLVNSAVDNFSRRIGEFIQAEGLLPQVGYRVRTLHGLANDIVRERPALVGLSNDYQIIDERTTDQIMQEISRTWLKNNPFFFDQFFDQELDESRWDWIRREQLPNLVSVIANNFIQYAKDNRLDPDKRLLERIEQIPDALPLARMGFEIYQAYQKALIYRGALDFTDLIRFALQALETDADYLARLQYRWPYILEDEAQDSSLLQEQILRKLAGPQGNWVRVGDPNQAIFETFTTADPNFLRDFIREESDFPRELPNSGRSTTSIIDLANDLIDWTNGEHPREEARDALSLPYIQPTPPGDPQPNPQDRPEGIHLVGEPYSPEEEVEAVAGSVKRWLEQNPEKTVAILVPRNTRGFKVVDALRNLGIEPIDSLLRSSTTTRLTAGAIANIMQYLADPTSARKLAIVYRVWRREFREHEVLSARIDKAAELIRKLKHLEEFLWPQLGTDWLDALQAADIDDELIEELDAFRSIVHRWQGTVLLPADQMVLTLAQDIFTTSTELAIAHKLATLMSAVIREHPDWRLPELTDELAVIAKNERRFLGFGEEDQGFNPESHAGEVVIGTMHKAKGLEWDRVYLMSVSNYDFPSGMEYDNYMSDKWFVRDKLNLQAETLATIRCSHLTFPNSMV